MNPSDRITLRTALGGVSPSNSNEHSEASDTDRFASHREQSDGSVPAAMTDRVHRAMLRSAARRRRLAESSPSAAKMALVETLAMVLAAVMLASCVLGAQWPMLLLTCWMLLKSERVCVPNPAYVGEKMSSGMEAPEEMLESPTNGPRKLRKVSCCTSAVVNGTDPPGTFHMSTKSQVRAVACLSVLFFVAQCVFEIVITANGSVEASYTNIDRSANSASASNTTSTPVFSMPWYMMFGLWDATASPGRFVLNLVPTAVVALIALVLLPLVPARIAYYLPKGHAPSDVREPDPSDEMTFRSGFHTRSYLLLMFVAVPSALVFPSLLSSVIAVAALVFGCSVFLSPPHAAEAVPSCHVKLKGGESISEYRYSCSIWVFSQDSDLGTRIRACCLFVLHYWTILLLFVLVAFQNPLFEGWNTLPDAIASASNSTARMESSINATNMYVPNAYASPWFHRIGLLNIRSFYLLQSQTTSGVASGNVLQDSVVEATMSIGAYSGNIAARIIAQICLLMSLIIVTRHTPSSLYYVECTTTRNQNGKKKKDGADNLRPALDGTTSSLRAEDPAMANAGAVPSALAMVQVRLFRLANELFTTITRWVLQYSPHLTPAALVTYCVALPSLVTAGLVAPLTMILVTRRSIAAKARICCLLGPVVAAHASVIFYLFALELPSGRSWLTRCVLGAPSSTTASLSNANLCLGLASGVVVALGIAHRVYIVTMDLITSKKRRLASRLRESSVAAGGIETTGLTEDECQELDRRLWRCIAVLHANKLLGRRMVRRVMNAFTVASSLPYTTSSPPTLDGGPALPADGYRQLDVMGRKVLSVLPNVGTALTGSEVVLLLHYIRKRCPPPRPCSSSDHIREAQDTSTNAPLTMSLDEVLLGAVSFKDSGETLRRRGELMTSRLPALPAILSELMLQLGYSDTLRSASRPDVLRAFLKIDPSELEFHRAVGVVFFPVAQRRRQSSHVGGALSLSFTSNALFLAQANHHIFEAFRNSAVGAEDDDNNSVSQRVQAQPAEAADAANRPTSSTSLASGAMFGTIAALRNARHAVISSLQAVQSIVYHVLLSSGMVVGVVFLCVLSYRPRMPVTCLALLLCLMLSIWALVTGSLRLRKWATSISLATVAAVIEIAIVTNAAGFGDALNLHTSSAKMDDLASSTEANVGLDGFQSTVWELALYFLLFFALVVQRRVLKREESLQEMVTRTESTFCRRDSSPYPAGNVGDDNEEEDDDVAGVDQLNSSSFSTADSDILSWRHLKERIEWRILCDSPFFYMLQLFIVIIAAPILFVFLSSYKGPNYFCAVLLPLYLAVAWVATSHRHTVRGHPAMVALWSGALIVSSLALTAIALFLNPYVHNSFMTWLASSQVSSTSAYLSTYCGKSLYELSARGNSNTSSLYAELDVHVRAEYCAEEIGLRVSVGEASLTALLPWFAVLLCSAYEVVAARHYAKARSVANDELRSLYASPLGTLSEVAGGAASFMAAAERVVLALLALIEGNVTKVTWIIYFFAASYQPSILNVVYVLFFAVDVGTWIPMLYASLHLVALYFYPMSAFPTYWSDSGMEFVGLRRDITKGANGTSTTVYLALVGPALTLAINLVFRSARSLASDLSEAEEQRQQQQQRQHEPSMEATTATLNNSVAFADEGPDNDELIAASAEKSPTIARQQPGLVPAPPRSKSASAFAEKLRHLIDALETLSVEFLRYVYYDLIHSLGFEMLALVLLIGMSVNPRRAANVFYFISAMSMVLLLGRDRTVVNGKYLKLSALWYTLCVIVSLVLGLGLPVDGSARSANVVWFFGSASQVTAADGVDGLRYSWAYYLGAQPDASLLWSYFFVIVLLRLLARDLPVAASHPRKSYVVKRHEFVYLQDLLTTFQIQINIARQHNLPLDFLYPTEVKVPDEPLHPVSDIPLLFTTSAADAASAAVDAPRRLQSALVRRTVPIWCRLERPRSAVDMIIFVFSVIFIPSFLIFADGNSGSSVINYALLVWAVVLWSQQYVYRLYWYPDYLWWITVPVYVFLLLLYCICSVPIIAKYIENHPAVFEAFGLAEGSGTTMALSGTRVAAIVACLLQARLYNSFLYLGVLSVVHDVQRSSMHKFAALMKVITANEMLEDEEAVRREDERKMTMERLRGQVLGLQGTADGGGTVSNNSLAATLLLSTNKQHETQNTDAKDSDAGAERDQDKEHEGDLLTLLVDYATQQSISYIETMSQYTFGRQRPDPDDSLPWQCALVTLWVIQRRSDTILTFILCLNFVSSGTVYDAIPSLIATCYVSVVHPWAGRSLFNLMLGYLCVGVAVKGLIRFIASQADFTAQTSYRISIFLVQVPQGSVDSTLGSSSLAASDIAWDFVCMIAIMIHTRSCDVVGAYPLRPDVAVRHRQEEENELLAEAAGQHLEDLQSGESATRSERLNRSGRPSAVDHEKSDTEFETDSEDERLIQVVTRQRRGEEHELRQQVEAYEDLLSASRRRDERDFIDETKKVGEEMKNAAAVERGKIQRKLDGTDTKGEGFMAVISRQFSATLSNVRQISGIGTDLYTITILLETFCLVYAALAFFLLSGATSGSFIQSVINNNLPGYLVVTLLLMTLVMVVDRILYTYSSHQAADAQVKKYMFHISLAVGYAIFYIYWFADIATVSKTGGAALFMMKAVYLCLSGQQIRRGYPLFRRHDPITHSTNNGLLYSVYMNVPFLWDLRMMLDWTFSRTTLSFDDFVKVENIAAVVYSRYGNIDDANETRGYALPFSKKAVNGFLLFAMCIVIIFFPLMYYSTFNPSVGPNYVTSVQTSLVAETFGDFYSFGALTPSSSTLVPTGLKAAMGRLYSSWTLNGFLASDVDTQFIELEACSSALWSISPSGRNSMIALLVNYLADPLVNPPLVLDFILTVQQSRSISTGSGSNRIVFSAQPDAQQLLDVINNSTSTSLTAAEAKSSFSMQLLNFLEPTIIGAGDGVQRYSDSVGTSESASSASCELTLHANLDNSSGVNTIARYWCFQCQGLFVGGNSVPTSAKDSDFACAVYGVGCGAFDYVNWASASSIVKPLNTSGPYFVISSQRIPSGSSLLPINIGIIALYATFILSLGNVVRSWLTSSPSNIITEEMHDPTVVAQLISYIYLSRGGGRGEATDDLVLEEALFLELLDLIRSPERLLRETGWRRNAFDAAGKKIPIKPFLTW